MVSRGIVGALLLCAALLPAPTRARTPIAVTVTIDVASSRRPINPLIYGVAGATPDQLRELNASWHRSGGNAASRHNWRANATNRGSDWFFESVPDPGVSPGAFVDTFVSSSRAAGAEPVVTVPMGDWMARLGPGRSRLASFSIAKYGPQTQADWEWFPDAGSGVAAGGRLVRDNDPADASVRVGPDEQQAWVAHLRDRVRYYTIDNEPSLWFLTHRDVHPEGLTMAETNRRVTTIATAVKAADPQAHVMAPEEWGWLGFRYSGADQQWARTHEWRGRLPDRAAHGGADYLPWLLQQWRAHDARTGGQLVDTVSVHYYPQGGEFSTSVTPAMQRLRARSTRALWDPAYVDESWIGEPVALIPQLRQWVDTHYRSGAPIALTEYNWGAEAHISGALAQADLLGIFGREGLDMAARWTTPPVSSPTFQVMKLFRNYDGRRSTFGDTSVGVTVPDPDRLAVFAAVRSSDDALTIVVVNKDVAPVDVLRLHVVGHAARGAVDRYEVTAGQGIRRLAPVTGDGAVVVTVPAQSVTLLVVPGPRRVSN
jgi:Glycoside hydrolase family 44